jgi:hypothetical protein
MSSEGTYFKCCVTQEGLMKSNISQAKMTGLITQDFNSMWHEDQ